MIVYPAIDLRQGKCVRLSQGRFDRATTYADDPLAVARGFAAAGASWLHVVDLDGAKDGNAAQTELILRIARLHTRLGDAWEWKGECEHEFRAAAVLSGAEPLELGIAIDRGFGAMLADGWHEIPESELGDEQITAMVAELLRLVSERARMHAAGRGVDLRLDSLEKSVILQTLKKCDGNRTRAAEALGISVRTLQRRLKVWGVTN